MKESDWTSVKDKLPRVNNSVLVSHLFLIFNEKYGKKLAMFHGFN